MTKIVADAEKAGRDDVRGARETRITLSPCDSNQSCAMIVDVVFDKLIELMNRDEAMDPLRSAVVMRAAQRTKGPIKQYVLGMSKEDARDIVEKVRKILEQ